MPDKNQELLEDLKQRFCKIPFEFADLSYPPDNYVLPCCWVNQSIGKLTDTNSVLDIWNSPEAQEVRRSILDGNYKHCRIQDCPHINNGSLPKRESVEDPYYVKIIKNNTTYMDRGPQTLHFNVDQSCNLSCPSCRTETTLYIKGPEFEKRQKIWTNSITPEILANTKELNITGAGDPFASRLYREFLIELDGKRYPEIRINLFTNGVLFNASMWEKINKIQRNILDVRVSMDAMTEDTYKIVRRGGNFNAVLENTKFLADLKSKGYFRNLVLCFVVQALNYKEMKAFVQYAKSLKFAQVHFQRIINWGTFSDPEFKKHAIYLESHPEYQNFLHEIKDDVFRDQIVDMGNISQYLS